MQRTAEAMARAALGGLFQGTVSSRTSPSAASAPCRSVVPQSPSPALQQPASCAKQLATKVSRGDYAWKGAFAVSAYPGCRSACQWKGHVLGRSLFIQGVQRFSGIHQGLAGCLQRTLDSAALFRQFRLVEVACSWSGLLLALDMVHLLVWIMGSGQRWPAWCLHTVHVMTLPHQQLESECSHVLLLL